MTFEFWIQYHSENCRLLTNFTVLFGQKVLWRRRRWYFVEYDGCLKVVKTLCIKTRFLVCFLLSFFKIVAPKIVYTQVRKNRRAHAMQGDYFNLRFQSFFMFLYYSIDWNYEKTTVFFVRNSRKLYTQFYISFKMLTQILFWTL